MVDAVGEEAIDFQRVSLVARTSAAAVQAPARDVAAERGEKA